MKYIITGCAGFIGFHISKKILDMGYKVYGVDNIDNYYDISLKNKRLKILKSYKNFFFSKFDLSNKKKLSLFFKNKKNFYVIHLAAQAGVRLAKKNSKKYFKSNVVGFFNILENLKNNKPKLFIFASSSSVYGNQKKYPVKEDADISKPLSFYGATKSCNEIMSYSYSLNYNIKTVGLRFFSVYGPYGRPDMAYFKFTKALLLNKKFEVYNNGNYYRDLTYIDDVVKSIIKLIIKSQKSKKIFDIFNIGRSKPVYIDNFVKIIIKKLGKKKNKRINIKSPNIDESYKTYSNSRKLFNYTNFRPKINFDKGIKMFVTWFQKQYK